MSGSWSCWIHHFLKWRVLESHVIFLRKSPFPLNPMVTYSLKPSEHEKQVANEFGPRSFRQLFLYKLERKVKIWFVVIRRRIICIMQLIVLNALNLFFPFIDFRFVSFHSRPILCFKDFPIEFYNDFFFKLRKLYCTQTIS